MNDTHSKLLTWMAVHGFNQNCGLVPAHFSGTGRGLQATTHFKPGSVLLSIPEKLLITGHQVFKSFLGDLIESFPNKQLTALDALCVFLMCEKHKGASSDWLPYISVLPTHYTNAANWTEADITLLPQPVRAAAEQQHRSVRKTFQDLSSLFELVTFRHPDLKEGFTLEAYLWAWSTVNSRCVYMKQPTLDCLRESEADNYALAPFLDLLNHSANAQVEAGFNKQSRHYEIRTKTGCGVGEQALINYGPHDNSKLLVEYGFILPDNPNNALHYDTDDLKKLGTDKKLTCLEERMKIILESELCQALFCSMDGLSWNLEMALGVLALPPHQLCQWRDVLMGDRTQPDIEASKDALTRKLLQRKKAEIQLPTLHKNASIHQKMAAQISQEYIDILDKCWSTAGHS